MSFRDDGPVTQADLRANIATAEVDEGELVRVVVNRNRYLGWEACYSHVPEVYQPDAEGFCIVVKPYIHGQLLEKAIDGPAVWPERAIGPEFCDNPSASEDDRPALRGITHV